MGWIPGRKVAAGTFVSVGISCLVAGATLLGVVSNVHLGWTLVSVGALCFLGAAYEWYFRKDSPMAAAGAPPVQPQIVASATFRQAYLDDDGQIHFGRDEKLMRPNSFVLLATFRNEPTEGHPSRPVKSLSASVGYEDHQPVGTGFWLGSQSTTVDLDIHCEQSVALVYVIMQKRFSGHASVVIDARAAAAGKIEYISFRTIQDSPNNSASPEHADTDALSLTIAEGGKVLGTAKYELNLSSVWTREVKTKWHPHNDSTIKVRMCPVVEQEGGYAERNSSQEPPDKPLLALIATVRNDSVGRTGFLRAQITYVDPYQPDAPFFETAPDGAWLDEETNTASFRPADTRALIVALYDPQAIALMSVTDNRRRDDPSKLHRGRATARQLPRMMYIAFVKFVLLDSDSRAIDEMEERFGIEINERGPTITALGPPGSLA
jgi:hypothetical protein